MRQIEYVGGPWDGHVGEPSSVPPFEIAVPSHSPAFALAHRDEPPAVEEPVRAGVYRFSHRDRPGERLIYTWEE